jgi:hypothetical protein
MDIDLGAFLGATKVFLTQRLTLYVPDTDSDGNKLIDHDRWIQDARQLLTHIGSGSTMWPPAEGTWMRPDGKIIWEKTSVLYTYVIPDQFKNHLPALRRFLHQFGLETKQGQVVLEFEGEFYRIENYAP